MSNSKEKLFTEFKAPTTQEWLDKIEVDLKGADFNKRLVWRTNEGFNVQPFYRREDVLKLKTPDSLPGEFPFVRGNKKDDNTWYIRQDIVAADAVEANKKALDILNKGIDSLGFRIHGDKVNAEFIEQLLDGILCDVVEVNFHTCQRHALELAQILTAYFEKKGYDKEKVVGSIDFDPLQKMVIKGKDVTPALAFAPQLVEAFKDYPNFRCICVNTVSLNNAGAYIVQELGYALAWGNEYLQQLVDAGVDVDLAAKKIKFNMGVSENYFMELAKFRAARLLWAQIVKQYEPKCDCACKMCVNAVTSKYNQTLFDSYVNLLRSQTEAMSAALAGVHSMVVTPFDVTYEEPTDFSERIARNQQLLLKEECHFNKVVDPGAGSYYIEHLTDSLAVEENVHLHDIGDLIARWLVVHRGIAMAHRLQPSARSSCSEPTSSRTSQRKVKANALLLAAVDVASRLRNLPSRRLKAPVWLPISRICAFTQRRPRCPQPSC